ADAARRLVTTRSVLVAGVVLGVLPPAPVVLSAAGDAFPVSIEVDAASSRGDLHPIWRFFGADEPNYAYMKAGRKLLANLRPPRHAWDAPGLLPCPQPPDNGRRNSCTQVGQHERLHRGRAGPGGLRLGDRGPHFRHVPAARPQAVRADRLHAAGALR